MADGFRYAGRVAMVTGFSRGIGKATARRHGGEGDLSEEMRRLP